MAYNGVEDGYSAVSRCHFWNQRHRRQTDLFQVKYPFLPDHVLTRVLLQPSYLRGEIMLPNGTERAIMSFPSPPWRDIGDSDVVLLRACEFREGRSVQTECLPIGTEMLLNGSYLSLDSEKPLPLGITYRSVGRNIGNRLIVFSAPHNREFYIAVMIYRKQHRYPTSSQLSAPVTNGSGNGRQKSMTLNLSVANLTHEKGRAFVKNFFEKQRRVSDISTNDIEVSLLCPISRTRLTKACRGSLCKHLQCFDEEKFKQTTAGKLLDDIKCPICHRHVRGIVADDFMQQLLKEAADDCTAVVFQPDASWTPVLDETDLSFVDLTQDWSVNCSKDGSKQDDKDDSVIDLTGV